MAKMMGRNRIRPPGGNRDDPWFTDPAGARRRQRHREAQQLPTEITAQQAAEDDDEQARAGSSVG